MSMSMSLNMSMSMRCISQDGTRQYASLHGVDLLAAPREWLRAEQRSAEQSRADAPTRDPSLELRHRRQHPILFHPPPISSTPTPTTSPARTQLSHPLLARHSACSRSEALHSPSR